jgi:quercetin dioxygenase-like cupin family protein
MERPILGDVQRFDLGEEVSSLAEGQLLERSGRTSRTLVKDGPLRVTLIVLAAGGRIPEHQADGPITVQPLQGRIRFAVGGGVYEAGPGQLLSVGAGIRHAVESTDGAAFLLILARPSAV